MPKDRLGLRAIHADHALTKVGKGGQRCRRCGRARGQPREKPIHQRGQCFWLDRASGGNGQPVPPQLLGKYAAQIIGADGGQALRRTA